MAHPDAFPGERAENRAYWSRIRSLGVWKLDDISIYEHTATIVREKKLARNRRSEHIYK